MKQLDYNEYGYLWPARPAKKIPPSLLKFYEKRHWVAQYKKNGTCTVLFVSPNKEIIVKTRHNTDHKMWQPTEKSTGIFKTLPGDSWYVFLVEVLHNKTVHIKDTVYIFDILVADGSLLTGTSFRERQKMLQSMFTWKAEKPSHYIVEDNVWLAKTHEGSFGDLMKFIQRQADSTNNAPEDEGLVLKNPDAKLKSPNRKSANSEWQVKCRVGHKNYTF